VKRRNFIKPTGQSNKSASKTASVPEFVNLESRYIRDC
jgi:hypothetical protein